MHDRDMIWMTSDGKNLKLREIPTSHLCNIINHVDKHIDAYNERFGKKRIANAIENFNQEMRLRKLNRLNITEQEQNLF